MLLDLLPLLSPNLVRCRQLYPLTRVLSMTRSKLKSLLTSYPPGEVEVFKREEAVVAAEAVGKWESRSDFQARRASVFSTAGPGQAAAKMAAPWPCRYFDLVREMNNVYNHRLRLVESAKQRGIKPTARLFATTCPRCANGCAAISSTGLPACSRFLGRAIGWHKKHLRHGKRNSSSYAKRCLRSVLAG